MPKCACIYIGYAMPALCTYSWYEHFNLLIEKKL